MARTVTQSDLTQLWTSNGNSDKRYVKLLDEIGKYFTIGIVLIASGTLAYWWQISDRAALQNFISVLIIACPCVLALSIPFVYGTAMRLLQKEKIYTRDTNSLLKLSEIDHVVFDKTGTLTDHPARMHQLYCLYGCL